MILSASFGHLDNDFESCAGHFLGLLRVLSKRRYFSIGFDSAFGNPVESETEFVSGFRDLNADDKNEVSEFSFSVASADDFHQRFLIDFRARLKENAISTLVIQWWEPIPAWGREINLFIETIDTIITWKRPQHVRCGPPMYFLNDHPLDKARSGLGWLGWLPFDIAPAEVPEAAIVLPMQGGTFLASQREWWIAYGPERDEAAVRRAQALELRLNVMGLLPTNIELRRGDWGQRGIRP